MTLEKESEGWEGLTLEKESDGCDGLMLEKDSDGWEGLMLEKENDGWEGLMSEKENAGWEGLMSEKLIDDMETLMGALPLEVACRLTYISRLSRVLAGMGNTGPVSVCLVRRFGQAHLPAPRPGCRGRRIAPW